MKQKRPRKTQEPAPFSREWIIETVVSFGLALTVVLMFKSSVFEAFKIPSGSMIPTLLVGDHILVNKFAYGFKLPFFGDWFGQPIYPFGSDYPKHGDVVVFKYPRDESIYFIKRVIGLPGETVEMRNKVLFINQKMVTRDPIAEASVEKIVKKLDNAKYDPYSLELFEEHLDTVNHQMMIDKASYQSENFGPITVPEGYFFVMGDNRDYSSDSRVWGFVPRKNLRGKAIAVFWSLTLSENFTFRPDRIGTLIH